jgi:hypothetical protein
MSTRSVLSGPVSSMSRVHAAPRFAVRRLMTEASSSAVKHDIDSPLGARISDPLRELGSAKEMRARPQERRPQYRRQRTRRATTRRAHCSSRPSLPMPYRSASDDAPNADADYDVEGAAPSAP